MGVVAIFGPGTSVAKAACKSWKSCWKNNYSTLDNSRKGYPDGGVAFFFLHIKMKSDFQ